jgi:hypothetical protein
MRRAQVHRPGHDRASVLVLTHRRALGRDQATRFGCDFYADFSGKVASVDAETGHTKQVDHLVCCVNSLPRLPKACVYTYVVIDEVGLVRRHLVSEITHSVLGTVMLRLKGILARAECIIMSQAQVSTNDILFFSRYKNVDPTDRSCVKAFKFDKPVKYHPVKWTSQFLTAFHKLILHYRSTLAPLLPGRNVGDHMHHYQGISPFVPTASANEANGDDANKSVVDSQSQAESDVDTHANTSTRTGVEHSHSQGDSVPEQSFAKGCRTPFVVYSTSKQMADCMSWVLSKVAEEEGADASRIKLLTGDTRMNEGWEADFLSDPNAYSWQADVVIATNVIGAGFSIDSTFYGFFAFFFNEILSHDEEAQLSVRLRFQIANMLDDERRQSYMFIESGRGESYHLDTLKENIQDMGNVEAKFFKDHRILRTAEGRLSRRGNDQNAEDYNSLSGRDRASITNTKLQEMTERRRTFVRHRQLWEDRMKMLQMTHVQLDDNEHSNDDMKSSQALFNQWSKTRKIAILDQLQRRHIFSTERPFCPLETIRAIERGQHIQIAELAESDRRVIDSDSRMAKHSTTEAVKIMKQMNGEYESGAMANIILLMQREATGSDTCMPTTAHKLAKRCNAQRRFIRWCAWCYQDCFVDCDIETVSSLWDHLHASKRSYQYTATLILADLILFELLCKDEETGGTANTESDDTGPEFLQSKGSWPFFTGMQIKGSKPDDKYLITFFERIFIQHDDDDHLHKSKKDIYKLCLAFLYDAHNNNMARLHGITTDPRKAWKFTKLLMEKATGVTLVQTGRKSRRSGGTDNRRYTYTMNLNPYDIALALVQQRPFCGLLRNTLPALFGQNALNRFDKETFEEAIRIYNSAISKAVEEGHTRGIPDRLCLTSIRTIAAERISLLTLRHQQERQQLQQETESDSDDDIEYSERQLIGLREAQARVDRHVQMQNTEQWRREVANLRRQPSPTIRRRNGTGTRKRRRSTSHSDRRRQRNPFILDEADISGDECNDADHDDDEDDDDDDEEFEEEEEEDNVDGKDDNDDENEEDELQSNHQFSFITGDREYD